MKLATILITLLLIGGFVTGFGGFLGALAGEYGTSTEGFEALNTSAGWYQELQNDTSSMYGTMNESQSQGFDTSSLDAWSPTNLVFGAYNAAMLVIQAPAYFMQIIYDLGSAVGVPGWFITMLYAIVSVTVIFALIGFLTGRVNTD